MSLSEMADRAIGALIECGAHAREGALDAAQAGLEAHEAAVARMFALAGDEADVCTAGRAVDAALAEAERRAGVGATGACS